MVANRFRWIFFVTVLGLLSICGKTLAEPITRQQALTKAKNFLKKEGKMVSQSNLRHAPARKGVTVDVEVPYYVFNVGSNEGFVVVSGDDLAPEILGYSTKGSFDIDEIPEAMKGLLEDYAQQIEYLKKHPSAKVAEVSDWDSIDPLIKTEWGQEEPYNEKLPLWKDCSEELPEGDNRKLETGCVATALSQLFYYFYQSNQYPKGKTKLIPKYVASINDYLSASLNISASFFKALPPTYFDWENMLCKYDSKSKNYTESQVNAVAQLMQYCSQAVKMNFSIGKNVDGDIVGESLNSIGPDEVMSLFHFNQELYFKKGEFSNEEWEEGLHRELMDGRPIYFGGRRSVDPKAKEQRHAGHAFIVDGYNKGKFHINWGWDGRCNGDYVLSILNPILEDGSFKYLEGGGYIYDQQVMFLRPDNTNVTYDDSPDFFLNGLYYRVVYTPTFEVPSLWWGSVVYAPSRKRIASSITDDSYGGGISTKNIDCVIVTRGDEPYEGDITIPSSIDYNGTWVPVKGVDSYAFYDCDELTSVTFEGKPTLEEDAFQYCSNLKDVYVTYPYAIDETAFDVYTYNTAILHVPDGLLETFENLKGWKNFFYKVDASGYSSSGHDDGKYIQFADNNFKEICLSQWDTNGDGLLSKEEAAAVTNIGSVFKGNAKLTSLDELKFFTGLMEIPNYAFHGCDNLVMISLPSGILKIGEGAFWNCENLVTVNMNEGLKELGDGAFAGCISLSEVEIPKTLEKIGKYSFQDCASMTSCTLPDGITKIPFAAFIRCSGLMDISLPSGVTIVDHYAFTDCHSLVSMQFPDNLKYIGIGAFAGCSELKVANLPESLEIMDMQVFGKTKITSLNIPSNVKEIGLGVVGFCDKLISLAVDENNPYFRSENNCIIDRATNMLVQGCTYTTIPTDIDGIADYGFIFVKGVEKITLPENIKSIGYCSFQSCTDLKMVTLPKSLTVIADEAFLDCATLESVTVLNPEPVNIADNVFYQDLAYEENGNTSFTTATLYVPKGSKAKYQAADGWKNFQNIVEMVPSDPIIQFADAEVKRICVENWDTDGDGELSEKEAAAVTDLNGVFKMNASITSFNELKYFTGLTTIPDYSFNPCSALRQISIPEGVESIGYGAMAECDKLEIVELPTSLKNLGDFALYDCPALKQIVLPDNLVNIGIAAFADCTSLQDISVPAGVTMMADAVLSGCTSLGSVNLSSSLVEVGPYAFADCVSLQDIGIPAGVTKIAEGAFWGCTSLGSANLPSTLVEVGQDAFADCVSLRSIDIPNGVETISRLAFSSCTNLSNVTLPATLKVIDDGAFAGSGLKQVALPSTLETIGIQAFGRCVNLTALSIPANVSSIGYEIVGKCRNLKILTVATENQYFRSNGNAIINRTTNKLVQACPTTVIPTDIVGIEDQGFAMTDGLEEIVIPENIKSIGMSAFEECKDLKRVTIPAGIQSIGKDAFLECAGLEQVTVLSPVPVTIEDNVFHMTEIWSEDLTESTTSDFTSATLYVPKGSKAKYQAADGWKNFQNIVEIDVPTGIALPATVERFDVYSPSGVLLRKSATSMNGLKSGVYIVNGKRVMVK